jgi:hypothetical protein
LYGIVTTSLGQPSLPAVYVPHPIVSVPHPEMRARAEPVMAAIVESTTEIGARANGSMGRHAPAGSDRPAVGGRVTVDDDPESIFERFTSEGWTDGLPFVPPTQDRVAQMLAQSDLDPSLSLGPMPPRWGEATIAALAVNAVMAGCTPPYFPVLVTAAKAILCTPFNLYGIQGTTNPASPVLIVNGPIAPEIGLNARGNLFGPGFRANATIGRAIRLIMTTIGGGVPQQADKSTLGSPAKYTCCFAENEADSPWAPLHVERGFAAATSTVTAFGGAAPANIIEKSKTAGQMLETIARAMAVSGSNNMFMSQEALLVLGPEHASIAARQGFDKERVRRTLFEQARIPFEQIGQDNAEVLAVWRGPCIEEAGGRRTLRITEKPEDLVIVVAGGAGNHSASIPGWYSRSVTLPITRADGAPVRSVAELRTR